MSRISNFYGRSVPREVTAPKFSSFQRVGDKLIEVEDKFTPQSGLYYDDFSVKSLIDSGSTELLQGHYRLSGSEIENHDILNGIDVSSLSNFSESSDSTDSSTPDNNNNN